MAPTLTGLVRGVLEHARVALDQADASVGLAHLAPGAEVAWDNCCEGGGQLYVRVLQQYPSGRPFPSQDLTASSCAPAMRAALCAVGVIRCAHTLDSDGRPPTAEEMTGDAEETLRDAEVLWKALVCDVKPVVLSLVMGAWTPLGPQGGCVGGEWQFYLGW